MVFWEIIQMGAGRTFFLPVIFAIWWRRYPLASCIGALIGGAIPVLLLGSNERYAYLIVPAVIFTLIVALLAYFISWIFSAGRTEPSKAE